MDPLFRYILFNEIMLSATYFKKRKKKRKKEEKEKMKLMYLQKLNLLFSFLLN